MLALQQFRKEILILFDLATLQPVKTYSQGQSPTCFSPPPPPPLSQSSAWPTARPAGYQAGRKERRKTYNPPVSDFGVAM
jgi:hypothetical protein